MLGFLKKLFGGSQKPEPEVVVEEVPYKVETPVNPQITDAVTEKPATPAAKPAAPKKSGAPKKTGNKPRGPRKPKAKPATQK